MSHSFRVRFRVWHLLAAIFAVSVVLWLYTQAGMMIGEIEIEELSGIPPVGRSVQQQAFETTFDSVGFRFISPKSLSNTDFRIFLKRPATSFSPIAIGDRVKFRYRARPILWLEAANPQTVAIESLGISPNNVVQVIEAVQYRDRDYNTESE